MSVDLERGLGAGPRAIAGEAGAEPARCLLDMQGVRGALLDVEARETLCADEKVAAGDVEERRTEQTSHEPVPKGGRHETSNSNSRRVFALNSLGQKRSKAVGPSS
jgi:hypothetical protein